MSSSEKNTWTIFNGKTNNFECKRCGDKKHMELPMECTEFAHIGFAFANLHDYCKEPKIECDYEKLGSGM
jgi:hypothetical protein